MDKDKNIVLPEHIFCTRETAEQITKENKLNYKVGKLVFTTDKHEKDNHKKIKRFQ